MIKSSFPVLQFFKFHSNQYGEQMKRIIVLLILIITYSSYAKFEDKNSIFATGTLNIGNYYGLGLNLNYVYDGEYSVCIGYTGNIRKPITQPENYSSGLIGIFFLGLTNPFDHFDSYIFTLGRIYNLNESVGIRANVSAGVGLTTIKESKNWKVSNDGVVSSNYTWNYYEYNTVSFIFNPKIEYLYSKYFGLTLSPIVQINKDRVNYGIGAGLMIGLLRN